MTFAVVRGDARRLPLPDASVDLIVTSPPYFALRSYTDGGEHYAGQIGSEPTPAAYIAALIDCTREWARVLKSSGSIFVNLGDKYAGSPSGPVGATSGLEGVARRTAIGLNGRRQVTHSIPNKSLMLLPERYRIACVDQLGLIARAVIVWAKPNGLPESVTDRVRRSHEDWVHLTKQPRYYAAVDQIREPHTGGSNRGRSDGQPPPGGKVERLIRTGDHGGNYGATNPDMFNPLGKLPGSVWEVATEPLKVPERLGVDHFAAFPSEWPKRLIFGWSPPGICTACDQGRRPVSTATVEPTQHTHNGYTRGALFDRQYGFSAVPHRKLTTITGYACACTPYTDHPESEQPSRLDPDSTITVGPWREYHFDRWTPPPTTPAVVVDPFGGTGTTAHVAAALGRTGITVDLSADYSRVAAAPELYHQRRRKVLGLDKPVLDVVPEGQLGFDWEGATA